jgi:hypothetical protein
MLYGDWEEAYNGISRLLGEKATTNPGMVHVVEPYLNKTRIYKGKWFEYLAVQFGLSRNA